MATRKRVSRSIKTAAKQGKLALLEAMRDKIAAAIDDGVPPRDLASLTRRLLEIEEEIEAARVQEEGDVIGEATQIPDATWVPGTSALVRPT